MRQQCAPYINITPVADAHCRTIVCANIYAGHEAHAVSSLNRDNQLLCRSCRYILHRRANPVALRRTGICGGAIAYLPVCRATYLQATTRYSAAYLLLSCVGFPISPDDSRRPENAITTVVLSVAAQDHTKVPNASIAAVSSFARFDSVAGPGKFVRSAPRSTANMEPTSNQTHLKMRARASAAQRLISSSHHCAGSAVCQKFLGHHRPCVGKRRRTSAPLPSPALRGGFLLKLSLSDVETLTSERYWRGERPAPGRMMACGCVTD
ncbi:hypothetical protein LX32DRAFT_32276 [Colletotrichum zoysiae]|uniref:Uncharacterized protein n=1 Tax=Colletotrichum zoysiae TaxID=1216348 RepID=A0AAD9M2A8_9PEZI|nr:hypothetical protein LX32DRAFT_32276 [Colletotrichum zoysiae]